MKQEPVAPFHWIWNTRWYSVLNMAGEVIFVAPKEVSYSSVNSSTALEAISGKDDHGLVKVLRVDRGTTIVLDIVVV